VRFSKGNEMSMPKIKKLENLHLTFCLVKDVSEKWRQKNQQQSIFLTPSF